MVLSEFVPADHTRRALDRLRRLKQSSSVSKYLGEFRNRILTVNDMSEGEFFDIFVQGLKHDVRLELLKTQATGFEDAAKIALHVDSALWSSHSYKSTFGSDGVSNDTMEIGNVQQRTPLSEGQKRQRALDLKNNACVVCHTKNCRPWKYATKRRMNNVERVGADTVDTISFDDAMDSD